MRLSAPDEIKPDLRHAQRLELWTLFWMGTVIVVMWFAMGSSQAMRTAWIEDMLSLIPAVVFLVASRYEGKPANRRFPYGYFRLHSLAFLISAAALTVLGAFLLFDSAKSLLQAEHPTVAPVHLFGYDIWMGWLMIAALVYSVVPPLILGRLKLPVARRLNDKVLHTDALMQKADWTTALAGIAGIIGIGFGLWWADSAAAMFISFEILRDGIRELRIATAELVDGTPRALDSDEMAEDAKELQQRLEKEFPDATIRLRETGRYIIAHVEGADPPDPPRPLKDYWPGEPDQAWRLDAISFERS